MGGLRAQELQFTDVTAVAGITGQFIPAEGLPDEIDQQWERITGGAVAEDFDGDGWIDLFSLRGDGVTSHLYLNQQDGTFIEDSDARGADIEGFFMAVAAADYDCDGDIDIAVSSIDSQNVLLINDGTGNFTSIVGAFPESDLRSSGLSWGDLNNDGYLELAIGSWDDTTKANLHIYHNDGAGNLVHRQSYLRPFHFSPRFADLDQDGDQDLVAVGDFGGTTFFENRRGLLYPDGRSEVENGMGVAVADLNNNGTLDVFISSIRDPGYQGEGWGTSGNRLLLNNGEGDFSDITTAAGVRDGNWGWGSVFADFDNDGDLDLYHVTGFPTQLSAEGGGEQFAQAPAFLFQNNGDLTFTEKAFSAGATARSEQGRCAIAFDYDNDGDQDLFVVNNSRVVTANGVSSREPGTPVLLRNDTAVSHHWLKVQLQGQSFPHHSHGIGARIFLTVNGVTQMRELSASTGFNGHGPDRIAHFGLSSETQIDEVEVRWTNGDCTLLTSSAIDTQLTISSPGAELSDRIVNTGATVTAEVGGSAEWVIEGRSYPNPCTYTANTAGEVELQVALKDELGVVIRKESYLLTVEDPTAEKKSTARIWNEQALEAIRIDFPDPTKHARNLFHLSVAMWDTWAFYDEVAAGYLTVEKATIAGSQADLDEAISYTAYRLLRDRYADSVNANTILSSLDQEMDAFGYDRSISTTVGDFPAAIGNRIAETVLTMTAGDRANDPASFLSASYTPANAFLRLESATSNILTDLNRWQPLHFTAALSQNGQFTTSTQSFLGSHWGAVRTFALGALPDGQSLHLDPGEPPLLGGVQDAAFKTGAEEVISASGLLTVDPTVVINTSPGALGGNTLGQNDGVGYSTNPTTGEPYSDSLVPLADFAKVLAEYWADGPNSETPPGHWNTIANDLAEHPQFQKRIGGSGDELDPLEWDVKIYFVLNGALHDAAIAAWGCKRVYDYVRPISAIRHMASRGQSSDPGLLSYHSEGLPLKPGLIELITTTSSAFGQRHEHLADFVGELALYTWAAPAQGALDSSGSVQWIRATLWLPYQAPTFVTPAFPGYVSGHSVFSRAAAEVLTAMTGTPYFPGGEAEFIAKKDHFLEFDSGPSVDVPLRWATYYDAADQAGYSRIYGGIHFPVDDGPGRIIGAHCGQAAVARSQLYFDGSIRRETFSPNLSMKSDQIMTMTWPTIPARSYRVSASSTLLSDSFQPITPWMIANENQLSTTDAIVDERTQYFYRIERQEAQPHE